MSMMDHRSELVPSARLHPRIDDSGGHHSRGIVSSEAHLDVGNLDNLFRVPSLSTRRRFLGTAGDAHENS
jgi:hypothetical protein